MSKVCLKWFTLAVEMLNLIYDVCMAIVASAIYINLRGSRDCLCMSVAADGRPAAFVCLCHRAASFTYFGGVLRCPHKHIVTITKVTSQETLCTHVWK